MELLKYVPWHVGDCAEGALHTLSSPWCLQKRTLPWGDERDLWGVQNSHRKVLQVAGKSGTPRSCCGWLVHQP